MYLDITIPLKKKLLKDRVATAPVLYVIKDCVSDDTDLMIYYRVTQQLTVGDGINDKIFELHDCILYFDGNYADNGELTIEYGSYVELINQGLEEVRKVAKNNHLFKPDYYRPSKPPESNYGLIYFKHSPGWYVAFNLDTCVKDRERVQWWMICTFDEGTVDVIKDNQEIMTSTVVKLQSKFREWNDKVFDSFTELEIKSPIKFKLIK